MPFSSLVMTPIWYVMKKESRDIRMKGKPCVSSESMCVVGGDVQCVMWCMGIFIVAERPVVVRSAKCKV